jgi:hypothetical protein
VAKELQRTLAPGKVLARQSACRETKTLRQVKSNPGEPRNAQRNNHTRTGAQK